MYVGLYVCMHAFIIFVTINIVTDLFILYLVFLIDLKRYMLFQSFYRDFLFLKLQVCIFWFVRFVWFDQKSIY